MRINGWPYWLCQSLPVATQYPFSLFLIVTQLKNYIPPSPSQVGVTMEIDSTHELQVEIV